MTVLKAWAFKKSVVVIENCGIKALVEDSGLVVQPSPPDRAITLQKYLQQDSLRHCHDRNRYGKLYESPFIQTTVSNAENRYRNVIKLNDMRRFVAEPAVAGFADYDRYRAGEPRR